MITLQFVRATGLVGSLIGYFGGGPQFSHVDAVLWDGRLLGARLSGGVQVRDRNYLGDANTVLVRFSCSKAQEKMFYDFLEAEVGKPYDWRSIFAFIIERDWRDPRSWFCSELIASAMERAGVILTLCAPDNKITPPDLILVCSAIVNVKLN